MQHSEGLMSYVASLQLDGLSQLGEAILPLMFAKQVMNGVTNNLTRIYN